MKKISFIIHGTHRGREKNPLPKLKMTGKQHWLPKAKEYVLYKEYVRDIFLVAAAEQGAFDHVAYKELITPLLGVKPILKSAGRCRMDIRIYWSNKVHGDPENIFGAIADALFENDKHLAGSFDYEYAAGGAARVEAVIYFS